MIVGELLDIATWLEKYVSPRLPYFEQAVSVLEHNASQPSKRTLEEHLTTLLQSLDAIPVEQLNIEQSELLEKNGVLKYIGPRGRQYFDDLVRKSSYDPATAANEGRSAITTITNAIQIFANARAAVISTGMEVIPSFAADDDGILSRIHFQGKASIRNVVELEKWSSEWLIISQGLAAAADERPEDIRVVGASTGSVIIWVITSLTVSAILAQLIKRASTITLNVVEASTAIEQLRHTKVMNKAVEDMMTENLQKLKSEGRSDVVNGLLTHLDGKINSEVKSKLKKAVDKYFDFVEKGGEIDMIAPPISTDEETDALSTQIAEIRTLIEENRKLTESLPKLLSDAP